MRTASVVVVTEAPRHKRGHVEEFVDTLEYPRGKPLKIRSKGHMQLVLTEVSEIISQHPTILTPDDICIGIDSRFSSQGEVSRFELEVHDFIKRAHLIAPTDCHPVVRVCPFDGVT